MIFPDSQNYLCQFIVRCICLQSSFIFLYPNLFTFAAAQVLPLFWHPHNTNDLPLSQYKCPATLTTEMIRQSHNTNILPPSQQKCSVNLTIQMFCPSHYTNVLPLSKYKQYATITVQMLCHSHSSNALPLSHYNCSSTPCTVRANCFRDCASF